MNWEILTLVIEVLGLFLIVASLTYVARQLSQNTSMMRVAAAGERLERDFDLVLPIIEDKEFAEIWVRGNVDFDGLD